VANAFTLTSTTLGSVTLDTGRMALDPKSEITGTLDEDGALTLTLAGHFGPNTSATLDGQPVDVQADGDGMTVAVPSGKHTLVVR